MGCDIHEMVEVKNEHNWWNNAGHANLKRDYEMFAVLAGVRNSYNLIPISEPKGKPKDSCSEFDAWLEHWNGDAHSTSWLTLNELKSFDLNQEFFDDRVICSKDNDGNITSTAAWSTKPTLGQVGNRKVFSLWGKKSWDNLIKHMEKIKVLWDIKSDEDIRLCFFFDN